jgi:hypothetical protein
MFALVGARPAGRQSGHRGVCILQRMHSLRNGACRHAVVVEKLRGHIPTLSGMAPASRFASLHTIDVDRLYLALDKTALHQHPGTHHLSWTASLLDLVA